MQIIETVQEMQETALALKREGKRIGFVPTMGYLHEGHLSLMRIARPMADILVTSIFVNPTQFGPQEDLAEYPRNRERDTRLCREIGVDIIFYPSPVQMYASDHTVYVVENHLAAGQCGSSRPIHFRGVLTVVAKLFNVVQPDVAVFGQKDAQQFRLIQRMTADLNFAVQIVGGPIIRESDGLAMSSRNEYLSAQERKEAVCLYRALARAEDLFARGERWADVYRQAMESIILATSPSARVDYIELVDWETFQPLTRIERDTLVALAVCYEKARLIDNTILRP
jgi:pantoate--beta-alanine ligase